MLERSLSATGGNIPVPSYYTGLGIHLPTDTKDNGSIHSSDFLSLEKRLPNFPTAATFDSILPSSQISLQINSRTTNETRSLYVSRCRFFIRLFSTFASVGVVAGIASAYVEYYSTKDRGLLYAGQDIWPEYLDMRPSDTLLAVGCVTSFFSGGLLIAGIFPKIRHITRLSDILSLIVAVIGLPLAVFGACFLYWYNNNYHTFWTWSCDNRKIDHPEAQFRVVCGEIGFAFSMSWLVAAAESLMIINVIVGCIVVKRKNGETRLGV
ncbi:hypothetical protein P167DRAFT_93553 [Morchella conica CCBAS932]|uniref:MARVEL domain-containing protein n=2 Tax=Morchella sect. Distantes TaxID=1051054 RepID=A0A3N4KZD5_9PEZI|nr:hypothetical protein P167DRAFT_93553 [Morchella conica CCBAS932]